jgi:regulator of cell morphogenesis and NO signaling
MFELSTDTRISELETEQPSMLAALKSTGMFSDAGDKETTIGQLCMNFGLNPQVIFDVLLRAKNDEPPPNIDISELDNLSLTEIVTHIETVHHQPLRESLPAMLEQIVQVAAVYGANDERLYDIQALFEKMAAEIENHMLHEEEALFPMCRTMDESGEFKATRCGDRVGGPIQCMKNDHDQMKIELARLSELSDDFTAPEGASDQYQDMLKQLQEFAESTALHIHTEDYLLFPRAVETQAELRASA